MTEVWRPEPYQERIVDLAVEHPRFGVFAAPGLGKTATMLEVFRRLREDCAAWRMLVVGPLEPIAREWPSECEKWEHSASFDLRVLHGKGRDPFHAQACDIATINPAGLDWLVRTKAYMFFDTVVFDESTDFKKTNKRSRRARKIAKHCERSYILTGTPTPNRMGDLYGQIMLLDGGERLGTSLETMHARFTFQNQPRRRPGGMVDHWVPTEQTVPLMFEAVRDITFRVDEEELDLPPLVIRDVPVELPSAARALYQRLKKRGYITYDDLEIDARSEGAKRSKLRQLANGIVYFHEDGMVPTPETRHSRVVHTAKVEAFCRRFQQDGGRPTLGLYAFRHEAPFIADAIEARLGFRPPHIDGDVSRAQRDELYDAWNAGELPMLLALPTTIATGINLQDGGARIAALGLTDDALIWGQVIKRLHRRGQKHPVYVDRYVAQGTVDLDLIELIREKEAEQAEFLGLVKEYWR